MSSWVSESEFSTRLGNKILIAGLSEAGKTAVKRIFFMKKRAEDVDSLSATINYERMGVELNNVPITIVDLGGQRVFIRRFLSNFSPFIFSSVKAFLFVIDVAVKSTRNNAVQYFSACVEKLEKHSPNTEFFVFLHKNDLVINLPNYESIHAQLKEQFQLECDKEIRFLRTTIYRPETVIDAFGRIFEIAIPQAAQSSYVDHRKIGQVEEYAETAMTLKHGEEYPRCPECGNELSLMQDERRCSFCGYTESLAPEQAHVTATAASSSSSSYAGTDEQGSDLLESLTAMMQDAILREEEERKTKPTSAEHTREPIAEPDPEPTADKSELEELHGLIQESLLEKTPTQPSAEPQATQPSAEPQATQPSAEPQATQPSPESQATQPSPESQATQPSPESQATQPSADEDLKTLPTIGHIDTKSVFLQSFYGITKDQAEQLVDSAYDELFESAAQAGMPVPVLFEVFFKYIPYLEAKNIDISALTDEKLKEVFLANLNGILLTDEIFECLVLATKLPNKSVEDIVRQYLIKKRKKHEEVPEEKVPVEEKEPLPKIKDLIEIGENIGFTIKREDNNIRLTFFSGNHKIDSNLVSPTMTMAEVNYLLLYEVDFPSIDNKAQFIKEATKLVYGEIKKVAEEMRLQRKTVPQTKTQETAEKIVIKKNRTIETSFVPLLEEKGLFFCFKVIDNTITAIIFHKSRSLGNVELPLTTNLNEILKNIRSKLYMHITTPEEMSAVEQAVKKQFQILLTKIEENSVKS